MPALLELSNGLLRPADQVDALIVELSEGGVALIAPQDNRFRIDRRYRIRVDDQAGILQLRNMTPMPLDQVRIGASIKRLDLVLQELVADSIENARIQRSRIA